jgi:Ca2+-binding RTX toxin-like protein
VVNTEITGTADPDMGNTPVTPDETCSTDDQGRCSITHTSSAEGTTTYRSWIDDTDDEPTPDDPARGDEDPDIDEGRDEAITPGEKAEPDNTDVTEKTWTAESAALVMTPESDSAAVGECNPYVITLTDADNNPVPNAFIDVEQRHERATNQTANDEPTVGFCTPPESAGANPSNVDESRGDLGSGTGQENPNNLGTAGGETTEATDANGKVTIGIRVAPGNGSNGTGGVTVTAFHEGADNDDPDTGEPQDTSTKTWTPGSGEPGEPAGVSLEPPSSRNSLGQTVTYTATVSDSNGDPVEDAAVTWTEEGPGDFVSQETTTDASGRATAQVTSDEPGTQTITASATDCAEGAICTDSSTQTWGQRDPRQSCPGHGNDRRNQVVGTSGDDVLRGTNGNDVICGRGGRDTLIGRGGNDLLLGNGGNDTLRGGGGKDTLRGGGGNDALRSGPGNDKLFGNKGKDNLIAGGGNDRLNGGPGRDRCNSGPGRDRVTKCE